MWKQMKAYLLAKSLNKLRYKQDTVCNTNKRIKTGCKTQPQPIQKTNYMHSSFATTFWLTERNAVLGFRHTQNRESTEHRD
jgi:hypothetical protein